MSSKFNTIDDVVERHIAIDESKKSHSLESARASVKRILEQTWPHRWEEWDKAADAVMARLLVAGWTPPSGGNGVKK